MRDPVYSIQHRSDGRILVREWHFKVSIPENTFPRFKEGHPEIFVYADGEDKRFLRESDIGRNGVAHTAAGAIKSHIGHLEYRLKMLQEMLGEAAELKTEMENEHDK